VRTTDVGGPARVSEEAELPHGRLDDRENINQISFVLGCANELSARKGEPERCRKLESLLHLERVAHVIFRSVNVGPGRVLVVGLGIVFGGIIDGVAQTVVVQRIV
jgi:hypothetical protein